MKILGVIPARYASSRFPGKPLALINGKSMIQRVYEKTLKSSVLNALIVATDDERIFAHVQSFGGEVMLTNSQHASGTDRCYEVLKAQSENYNYVINIQGDEPFLAPEQINDLASILDGEVEIATQMIAITTDSLLWDNGEVKIVLNNQQEALYFSRSVIPFIKNTPTSEWHLKHNYFRHVGLYAYRADVLTQLSKLPVSPLEQLESLEQLRWLENGFKIKCISTPFESHCIDTPEDIEKVLNYFK